MDKIIDELIKEFYFYKNNRDYYENILLGFNELSDNTVEYIKDKIIKDMQIDWQNLNNTWFINYVKDKTIGFIIETAANYNLVFTMPILHDILKKLPELECFLEDKFNTREKYKLMDFDMIIPEKFQELCVTYILLNDRMIMDSDVDIEKDMKLRKIAYSDDQVKMYLQTVGVLYRLHKGKIDFYLKQYVNFKELEACSNTKEEKEKFAKQMLKYRNLLVEANLGLVVYFAKPYIGKGLDFLELCQEGTEGLIIGIEKFDITKGFKLSTYVCWWIRKMIISSTYNTGHSIKIPDIVHRKYNKIYRLIWEYKTLTGKKLTVAEIVEKTGFKEEFVIETLTILDRIYSLDDTPVYLDDTENLYLMISDPKADFENNCLNTLLVESLFKKLNDERLEFVIRMLYGIDNGTDKRFAYPHTQEEVAQELGVSYQRVQQLNNKALEELNLLARGKIHGDVELKENIDIPFWSNFKDDEHLEVYKLVRTLSDTEQLLLKSRYGNNLNSLYDLGLKENVRANRIIAKLKRNIIKEENIKKDSEVSQKFAGISSPIKNKFFKDIVLSMPKGIREVTILRLGINDGIMHDEETIAQMVDLSEEQTSSNIKQGIDIFIATIEKYREIFSHNFPDMKNEADTILKLIR